MIPLVLLKVEGVKFSRKCFIYTCPMYLGQSVHIPIEIRMIQRVLFYIFISLLAFSDLKSVLHHAPLKHPPLLHLLQNPCQANSSVLPSTGKNLRFASSGFYE